MAGVAVVLFAENGACSGDGNEAAGVAEWARLLAMSISVIKSGGDGGGGVGCTILACNRDWKAFCSAAIVSCKDDNDGRFSDGCDGGGTCGDFDLGGVRYAVRGGGDRFVVVVVVVGTVIGVVDRGGCADGATDAS